jgi:ribosome-binding factor A
MPEQRARKYHRDRVAETLRDEIGTMVQGELADPRIALAHVTEVVLNPGGKSAQVYVSVDPPEENEEPTMAALMAARGFIRRELQDRMGKRHVPELTFLLDRSQRMTARIDELLSRRRRTNRKPAAAPGPATTSTEAKPGA